jgi:uncharacterized protein YjiS (DUF1127 family)
MEAIEPPRAGRSTLPQRLCPARSEPAPAGRGRAAVLRLKGLARRVAGAFGAWRARRRARRQLEIWLTMDPRLLADLGLRPSDVRAMAYGGGARLAERGGRWVPRPAGTVLAACRRAAPLRVVADDDLEDAA